jgi:hypothetical protein
MYVSMKATTFVHVCLVVGLAGWAWWEHREAEELRRQLALAKETASGLEKAARLKVSLTTGAEVDPKGPRGLGDLVPPDKAPGAPAEGEEKKPSLVDPTSMMAEMLRTPEGRDALRAQLRAQLENECRDLFDQMGLDEAASDAVMKIMSDRALVQVESVAAAAGDPAAKAAASEKLKAETAKADAALREALGANYATFERFEKSAPERQQLKLVKGAFKDKGIAFDESTESKLMDTMYDVRSGWKFEHDFSDPAKIDPSSLNEEAMDRYVDENARMQAAVEEKVQGFLTAEQFEAFRAAQRQQQEMLQMGLRMSRGMFGGPRPKAPQGD